MALLARLVFLGLASAEVSRLESWHDISGAASAGAGGTVVVPYVEVVPGAGWAEVPPNASVAIGSAGGATVNGTGASRFFVVRGELALSNLTLVDGYNGSYGGGVASAFGTGATAAADAALGENLKVRHRDLCAECQPLRFLYSEYDPACWYFECVECVRRLVLTCLLPLPGAWADPESIAHAVFAVAVAVLFAFLYDNLAPFLEDSVDAFADVVQFLLFVNLFTILILDCDAKMQTAEERTGLSRAGFGTVLIVARARRPRRRRRAPRPSRRPTPSARSARSSSRSAPTARSPPPPSSRATRPGPRRAGPSRAPAPRRSSSASSASRPRERRTRSPRSSPRRTANSRRPRRARPASRRRPGRRPLAGLLQRRRRGARDVRRRRRGALLRGVLRHRPRRRRVLRRPPARGAARVSRGQLSDL